MSRPQLTLGIAILACGSLILCAAAADPKKPAKSKGKPETTQPSDPTPVETAPKTEDSKSPDSKPLASDEQGPWEVTDRVELVYKEKLTIAGDKTLTAKVQIKNKSESDIAGKLVLVVDGSTIPGTKLHQPTGQFTETTPYVQITPAKRKLEAGDESPVKTLILNSETSFAELNEDLKKSPELVWRVFTMTKPEGFETDPPASHKAIPGKNYTWGEMRQTMSIQEKFTDELLSKHPGAIVGTATSENANGKPVILVYATRGGMSRQVPGSMEGVPVEVVVTGNITAGPTRSTVTLHEGKATAPLAPEPETVTNSTPSAQTVVKSQITPKATQSGPPTKRFTRPVPIGVSSINQTVGVCATGTLGCRCIDRTGRLFALSNNHVFANENAGVIGNPISQPGPLDVGCAIVATDVVATLYDFQKISFTNTTNLVNVMDAAIGLTNAGQVDYQTWTPGYGTPSRFPQESIYPGMLVQKCGRTSGYTKGKITSLNSTIVVAYDPGGARFQGCIAVESQLRIPTFGAAGDSGSLVVTQADRRPIGLLFAGGSITTFLCPISPILNRFKVGVDDGTGSAPVLGSGRMGTAVGPLK